MLILEGDLKNETVGDTLDTSRLPCIANHLPLVIIDLSCVLYVYAILVKMHQPIS